MLTDLTFLASSDVQIGQDPRYQSNFFPQFFNLLLVNHEQINLGPPLLEDSGHYVPVDSNYYVQ